MSLMAFTTLVAMMAPLPRRFITVLPLVVAVVLAIRYLRRLPSALRRERMMPILTLVVMGIVALLLAVQALAYNQVRDYEQCRLGAQTAAARADCESLIPGLFGSMMSDLP